MMRKPFSVRRSAVRSGTAGSFRCRPPSKAWRSRPPIAIELVDERSPGEVVKALNRIEGVQSVSLNRETTEDRSAIARDRGRPPMSNERRERAVGHDAASGSARRGRRTDWLRAAHDRDSGAGAGSGARTRRISGSASVGSWLPGRRTGNRRAVRQERRQAPGQLGAQGGARVARRGSWPARLRTSRRSWRFRARRHDARVTWPEADARRRQVVPLRAALRPWHTAHGVSPVRERRLGAGTRRLQQHRRRGAGDGHHRRQDVPERRRPLSRRIVVHDGARGIEALAEPVVRLRRREAGDRQLSDAQPPERQRRPHVRPRGCLLRDRATLHSRLRKRTTCAWRSTARAGAST